MSEAEKEFESMQSFYKVLNKYYKHVCHEIYEKPHFFDVKTDKFRDLVCQRIVIEEVIYLYEDYGDSTISNFMFFLEELAEEYENLACICKGEIGLMYSTMRDVAYYIYDYVLSLFN